MSPDEELAELRRQYEHATLENNILVDGRVRLRCRRCGRRPVPLNWSFVALCDGCLDAPRAPRREDRVRAAEAG